MDEEKKAPAADVSEIIKKLVAEGLKDEEIISALEKAAQEGVLSPEDLEKGKEILNSAKEEQEAEKMFGMKFIK